MNRSERHLFFPFEAGYIFAAMALSAALVLCLLTLPNDFIWDDRDKISSVPSLDAIPLFSLFSPSYWDDASHEPVETGYYRPVVTISFALDNMLWNFSGSKIKGAWPYRIQGMFFSILTIWLVFRLFSTLLGGSTAGGITALLFAVHPLHVEVIAFLSARPDLLAGTFCLVSMSLLFSPTATAFAGSSPAGTGSTGQFLKPVGFPRLLLSAFFFAIAMLSKESAVILPACIVAASLLPGGGGILRILPVLVTDVVLLFFYFVLRLWIVGETAPMPDSFEELFRGLLLAGKTFLFYFRASFFPFGLSGDYGFPPRRLQELVFSGVFGLLLVVFLLSTAIKYRNRCPILPGATLWFIAALLPASNLLPIPQFQADRYAYLALVGWAALVAGCLSKKCSSGKFFSGISRSGLIFAFTMGIILTIISISRVCVWNNEFSFWSDVLSHDSANARGFYNHGLALEKMGDDSSRLAERSDYHGEAVEDYCKAVALNPAAWKVWLTYGELLWKTGDVEGSLNVNEQAASDFPDIPEIQHNAGVSLARSGRYRESAEAFKRAIELDENYALAYFHLAKLHVNFEEWKKAAENLEKCLVLDAENSMAAFMLGELYALKLDNPVDAEFFLKRALGFNPPEQIFLKIKELLGTSTYENEMEN